MAHNKSYRSFIILQEDEKGHSMASDKPLTGYAKIETKNDKCKVSFYAQNLKKDYKDCCMMLICSKKDCKKNINLGPMNISQQGKAEMSLEYDSINIGDLNISYENIVGAAIVKDINGRTIFFMCGFLNNQMPKDNWKNYEMKMMSGKEKVHYDKSKKEDEKKKEYPNIKEEKIKNKEEKDCNSEKEKKKEKDKDYEKKKDKEEKHEHDHHKYDCDRFISEIELEREYDSYEGECLKLDARFAQYENEIDDIKLRQCKNKESNTYEVNFNSPIGEVLMGALESCKKVPDFAKDIKRCAWYKVDVKNFDEMCNMSNYNKYTMLYYPMINYYPYISKSGHFFFGVKCDKDGEIKYILYAIPGSKERKDQPYGGRTGFVTWDEHGEKGNGYWIMFYDFENSSVVIPMK